MKLLNCMACHDVVALHTETRTCACGKSSGEYHEGGARATTRGEQARMLGISNIAYMESIRERDPTRDRVWFEIAQQPA